ncbi:nucleotide sugar dehydrogenase [Candidatus Woesearchaeota archaeon]|jgi:UDP-N-acetyl-D-glucosamine/UDP-N-acetyl-D-galactosamine dehydrogenase|nr:nucleotide sugar dehydrogenase [Candidatus Woesearchaeota archaeon]MBT5397266.1 nucleotide sugar dehydrogenase [Candidatus Woesearchaeota archaeon]MBT5924251.1 nucleotide sugar dehydrogenase [Candidatus Woesearchaeota archaeon]MBT6367188.1 nucleotide sugar dehydrogenase [Candidatus Woesearchaeota archaeon]MBT7762666.1 nucleotide sugar dehydrogenase [Candidatus Woesearchaeota archaeon]
MKINTIAIVGLGYVGLPLGVMLSNHFSVIGFDVNQTRVDQLINNTDVSHEVSSDDLRNAKIQFTTEPAFCKKAQVIIVCVPTPIDKNKKPDLSYVMSASQHVGENISPGTIVVYESTVYPGVTEDVCVPLIEKSSGLVCGDGFKVGYSPERMNPGDKTHTVDKIVKVVAGMDKESAQVINEVYGKITKTYVAPSIKVAEAAKVIENIQRDLNIALMNELAIIFDKMNINVSAVLEAAGTKWNFHKYKPGLVGGHCIGVDPYYLTYKAEEMGHHPQVILAGRRINDDMHKFYAEKIIKRLHKSSGKKVLILGLTFKPNVPDYRNSRVKHLIQELKEYNIDVYAYDPYLSKELIENEFCSYCNPYEDTLLFDTMDITVLAVQHETLLDLSKDTIITLDDLQHVSETKSSIETTSVPSLVIDTHTFFGTSERFGVKDHTSDYFSQSHFTNTRFFTIPFDSSQNKDVVAMVQQDEKFLGCYLLFNPNNTMDMWREDSDAPWAIDKLAQNDHVVGLKSFPSLSHTPLNDPKYFPYYELAIRHDIPVLLHCSASGSDYSSAHMIRQVCTQYPNLKLVLAHFGGLNVEYMQKAVALAKEFPNIYLNTTALDPDRVKRQVSNASYSRSVKPVEQSKEQIRTVFLDALATIPHKILFGSDLGYYPPEEYTMWPVNELSQEMQQKILVDNPTALFTKMKKL